MDTFVRRMRAGLLAALVALVMLASALPADAHGKGGNPPPQERTSSGITWE
jgi:hypothetical protein